MTPLHVRENLKQLGGTPTSLLSVRGISSQAVVQQAAKRTRDSQA